MKLKINLLLMAAICLPLFVSCNFEWPESAKDPLPFTLDENKDLTVNPGDDFFQYCNGSWLAKTPVPETGGVGGLLKMEPIMAQKTQSVVDANPSLKRYFQLMDEMYSHQEAASAFVAEQYSKYTVPQTREEFFRLLGKMTAEGISPLPLTLENDWKDGQIIGLVSVPNSTYQYSLSEVDPSIKEDLMWLVEGMGLKPQDLYYNDKTVQVMSLFKGQKVEGSGELIQRGFISLYPFLSEEALQIYNASTGNTWSLDHTRLEARGCIGYELSYYIAEQCVTPQLKQYFLERIEKLREAFRNRISNLDWMSGTTRENALDKLDKMMIFVGSPDTWYEDCLPDLSKCESLVEAVHILRGCQFRLRQHLIGTRDVISGTLTDVYDLPGRSMVTDLSLVNAFYKLEYNCIVIFPAMMLPPNVDPSVSEAYQWATFAVEAHEITHGFDSQGSKYDALGRVRNWWTVADQMAYQELQDKLVQCYSTLEFDPFAYPGQCTDGKRTLAENIADLGGFLIARDAFMAYLDENNFWGEEYVKELRKFYEAYADLYCIKYSPEKLANIVSLDTHSHCRLRVNGVVMNTDMWYDLYDVTRDNILYLPPERRTYIW